MASKGKAGAENNAEPKKKQPQQQQNGSAKKQPQEHQPQNQQQQPAKKKNQTVSVKSSSGYSACDHVLNGILVIGTWVLVLGSAYLSNTGKLRVLQPLQQPDLESMEKAGFASKLQFTARYWIMGLAWLYFYIHIVLAKRVKTGALNPLAGQDHLIQESKNIFTNSLEQLVMFIVAQLCAITYATPVQVINLIPLLNAFHLLGRIFFWIGYPKYRSLGFNMTLAPTSILFYYSGYQFLTQQLGLTLTNLPQAVNTLVQLDL